MGEVDPCKRTLYAEYDRRALIARISDGSRRKARECHDLATDLIQG
jgi:hypothetical protein